METAVQAQFSTWKLADLQRLDFLLPPELEAASPPEARGLQRDQVRLMVSRLSCSCVEHTRFNQLPGYLNPGDLLVINTSGTRKAALEAKSEDGMLLELHLSTQLPADLWVVELRKPQGSATEPFYESRAGESLILPESGRVDLLTPYRPDQRGIQGAGETPVRLWLAVLHLPADVNEYLERNGFPIRYKYVQDKWPIEYYQTVYATEMGSAEMPSAGRAFTPELITKLAARGIGIAPLILHTGVASLEDHEPPYEEYFRVPLETAQAVNTARTEGRRVIAVGTTSVRALESVAQPDGRVHPGEGWTNLIISPERTMRAVDGLLTGLHEPRSTHLAMLEALAGRRHLQVTYAEALAHRYLWHEFGDLHLILP